AQSNRSRTGRGGAADHRAALTRSGTAGVSRRAGSQEAGRHSCIPLAGGPHGQRRSPLSKKLEGKVAGITGGNSGIGLATARRFVAEGAHVFITGRRQAELDEAVTQIGRNVTGVPGDVSHLADLDRLFATVRQQQGHLDVLFANAGVPALTPLGSITAEHFDKVFTINVKGLLFTVPKALPLFADGGSIILNASIVASKGPQASSVYSATKAAVRSFARCWTTDLKHRKIR